MGSVEDTHGNSRGPSIKPCGTPVDVMSIQFLTRVLFRLTVDVVLKNKNCTWFKTVGGTPIGDVPLTNISSLKRKTCIFHYCNINIPHIWCILYDEVKSRKHTTMSTRKFKLKTLLLLQQQKKIPASTTIYDQSSYRKGETRNMTDNLQQPSPHST